MSLQPKKSLGQHFLKDQNILRKIATVTDAKKGEMVLEIGPGEGALTGHLRELYENVKAVEVDGRAIEQLQTEYPEVNIIHADILKVSWDELGLISGKSVVVGNIPYYITSPILFKIMDAGQLIRRAVLLMQDEVARRITASPGTKDYGILSVQAQVLGTPEYLFPVSRHVFFPKPKVESAVISWEPDSAIDAEDIPLFKRVVRTAFNQRRKKLSNSLKPVLNGEIEFDLNLRPDQLTPEDFITLLNAVKESDYNES